MRQAGTIFAMWFVLAAVAVAQMAPKPAPEVKKLDIFAGTWSLDGTMKPGMMGPGGTMSESEKCEWMEGGFFLICKSDYKSEAMGSGTGISAMGYSTDDKAYTYREFNSMGEFEDARGSIDGDTWTWTSDEKMEGMTMKGRFTMKNVSANVVQLHLRDVAGWNQVVHRDGRQGDKEIAVSIQPLASPSAGSFNFSLCHPERSRFSGGAKDLPRHMPLSLHHCSRWPITDCSLFHQL